MISSGEFVLRPTRALKPLYSIIATPRPPATTMAAQYERSRRPDQDDDQRHRTEEVRTRRFALLLGNEAHVHGDADGRDRHLIAPQGGLHAAQPGLGIEVGVVPEGLLRLARVEGVEVVHNPGEERRRFPHDDGLIADGRQFSCRRGRRKQEPQRAGRGVVGQEACERKLHVRLGSRRETTGERLVDGIGNGVHTLDGDPELAVEGRREVLLSLRIGKERLPDAPAAPEGRLG